MRVWFKAWFLAAAVSLGGVPQASAAEDCRLSGAWFAPGGDEIYTFTQHPASSLFRRVAAAA